MEEFMDLETIEYDRVAKMPAYIKTQPELYSFFQKLLLNSLNEPTISKYRNALINIRTTEQELEVTLEEIRQIQRELQELGIELLNQQKFAPKGYVPIMDSPRIGTYGKYEYVPNDKELEGLFGSRIKNTHRLVFPMMIKTEKGNLTLGEIIMEEREKRLSNRVREWLYDNMELFTKLITLDQELEKLRATLKKYEQIPGPLFDKKKAELREEIEQKKSILKEENKKANDGHIAQIMLERYQSITPQQKVRIKNYYDKLEHLKALVERMEKLIKEAELLAAEITTMMDVAGEFISRAIVKEKVTEEEVEKIDAILTDLDLSETDVPRPDFTNYGPMERIMDILLDSYCFDRIVPMRIQKKQNK